MADREQDFRLRRNYGHNLTTRLLPQCARDILQARPVDPVAYMGGWLHRSVDSQLCHERGLRVRTKCKDVAHEMDLVRQQRKDNMQELHRCIMRVREFSGHRPIEKEDPMKGMMARYYRRWKEAGLVQKSGPKKLHRISLPPIDNTEVGDSGQRILKVKSRLPPIKTSRKDETEEEDKGDLKELEDLWKDKTKKADKGGIILLEDLTPESSRDVGAGFESADGERPRSSEVQSVVPFDMSEEEEYEPESSHEVGAGFESAEGERPRSSEVQSVIPFDMSDILKSTSKEEEYEPETSRWSYVSLSERQTYLKEKHSPPASATSDSTVGSLNHRPLERASTDSLSGRHNYLSERQMSFTDSATGSISMDKAWMLRDVVRQFLQTKRRHEDILNIDQLTKAMNTQTVTPPLARPTPASHFGPITDGIKLSFVHPTLGILGGRRSSLPVDLIHQNMELSDINAVNCFNLYDPEIYVVCDPIHFLAYDYFSAQIQEMRLEDYDKDIDD